MAHHQVCIQCHPKPGDINGKPSPVIGFSHVIIPCLIFHEKLSIDKLFSGTCPPKYVTVIDNDYKMAFDTFRTVTRIYISQVYIGPYLCLRPVFERNHHIPFAIDGNHPYASG